MNRRNKGNGKKKESSQKYSALHCPANMSIEEWQRELRVQIAKKETFGIIPPENPSSGDFIVSSAKSGRKYHVHYYGEASPLNRCDCMDFKTSGLGTCKHIEALKHYAGGRYARKRPVNPEKSFVYVDYLDGRKVKIYRSDNLPSEFEHLIDQLFDADGVLKDLNCNPSELIRQAALFDIDFDWEEDALHLIIESRDTHRRKQILKEKYANSKFKGLLKTQLHPYQVEGVKFAFAEGRTINADEMGLGKTVQAIATAELLKRERLVDSVLIICPTSLKYQWISEIKRFTDSSALVVEGNPMVRRQQLEDPDYFYKICSYHAIANNIKGRFIPSTDMIIFDELQRLKNRETQTGKQLRKLSSQYVMALSGTPLENKLEELYSVLQLVDQFAMGPLYRLNHDTTLRDDLGKIVGYKNLHSVAEKLTNRLIRRKKDDVKLQMPSRTDTNMFVPMTDEQMEIHEEYKANVAKLIRKWKTFRFLSEKDRNRLLLFLSMMRMVCDSTFILDQKSRYDTKIDEILAIINNLLSQKEGKVVIFSQWERMLRILAGELQKKDIDFCFLHGGVPSKKRKDLIERFKDDNNCRIFLSTDAGATGLNLQSASLLINIDLPWNPAVLEQRIARIWRLGQQNPVQVINMISRGTIEERMIDTLKFKSNLAAGILDGGNDAIFIENKKFDKIVETLDTVFNQPEEDSPTTEKESSTPSTAPTADKEIAAPSPAPSAEKEIAAPTTEKQPGAPAPEKESTAAALAPTADRASAIASAPTTPQHSTPKETTTASVPTTPQQSAPKERTSASAPTTPQQSVPKETTTPQTPEEIRTLVAGGMTILGTIATALREPGKAQAIADALVKEDPATGTATLNIPVPDKTTVVNILTTLATLLK